jgi:hypothetical protein
MRQRGLRQRFFIDRHGSSARSSIGYWLRLIPNLSDQLGGAEFGRMVPWGSAWGRNVACPRSIMEAAGQVVLGL